MLRAVHHEHGFQEVSLPVSSPPAQNRRVRVATAATTTTGSSAPEVHPSALTARAAPGGGGTSHWAAVKQLHIGAAVTVDEEALYVRCARRSAPQFTLEALSCLSDTWWSIHALAQSLECHNVVFTVYITNVHRRTLNASDFSYDETREDYLQLDYTPVTVSASSRRADAQLLRHCGN